jgi:hypothetical protein
MEFSFSLVLGVHLVALYYTYTPQIYPESQLRFLLLFYSVRSQHVSAPTGHPQVKYNIIYTNLIMYVSCRQLLPLFLFCIKLKYFVKMFKY